MKGRMTGQMTVRNDSAQVNTVIIDVAREDNVEPLDS